MGLIRKRILQDREILLVSRWNFIILEAIISNIL